MKRLAGILGMSIGGWAGWAIGAPISIFTAFVIGMVGTGVGLYIVNRLAHRYLP